MARVDTPKKPAKRGRPSSKAANDCCRLCACSLKVKFGDFKKTTYVSTENLFQSKREGSECNKTLAELCSRMGLHVANSTALSDREIGVLDRKKGQRRSFETKRSLRFLENSENELLSEDKNEEMITPQLNKPLVELNLNVDDLLSYQSTQVKVAIVNPSCRVDLQFNDSISAIWSSIILFSGETMIAQVFVDIISSLAKAKIV